MARRLTAMGARGYERGFEVTLHPDRLEWPLQRRAPTVWFVNSMSDLFHADVPDDFIDSVLDTIRRSPQHTYQILTKRADRLPSFFASRAVPSNVWLGVSVEDRKYGVPRISHLRRVPANVRFLSVEPLLQDVGELDLRGIHWVIVGGESGSQARPMKAEWVQSVKRQCENAGVAFFFKQWGAWGADGRRRSKAANGRQFEGRTWSNYPETTAAA
jgi:protein gp37